MLDYNDYIEYIISSYTYLLSIGYDTKTATDRIKEEGLYLISPNAHYDEGYSDGLDACE